MKELAICLTTLMIVVALWQMLQGVWRGYFELLPWFRRTFRIIGSAMTQRADSEVVRVLTEERVKLSKIQAFIRSGQMTTFCGSLLVVMVVAYAFEPTAFIQAMIVITVVELLLFYSISEMLIVIIDGVIDSSVISWLSHKIRTMSFSSKSSLHEAPYKPPRLSLLVTA